MAVYKEINAKTATTTTMCKEINAVEIKTHKYLRVELIIIKFLGIKVF